ncbi:MAG: 4Fe-4S dicluster domain-containing protein [Candidatus Omnitrophica bacterium]|nr:4Fe-4S dicluster domain-containing protein [Candidatus Omnitrophota bacterium]
MAKVKIEKDRCKGCELCVFYCPLKSLELSSDLNKRGVRAANFKKDAKCSGCGFCFLICADRCIKVEK